nr:unnamed protein product [Callosobruchus chinensis]
MESDDEDVVAVVATLLLSSKRKNKIKRRYWVHPYYNNINQKQSTYLVAKELNNHPDKFLYFYRMSIQTFTTIMFYYWT